MELLLCAGENAGEGTDAMSGLAAALRTGRLKLPAFVASVERTIALRSSVVA